MIERRLEEDSSDIFYIREPHDKCLVVAVVLGNSYGWNPYGGVVWLLVNAEGRSLHSEVQTNSDKCNVLIYVVIYDGGFVQNNQSEAAE